MPIPIIPRRGTENGRQPHFTRQKARSAIGGAQWGKRFLSRAMAPKMPGCLKSMGGEPVVERRSLEGKRRGQWEAGLTVETRGVLTAELVHKPTHRRTES